MLAPFYVFTSGLPQPADFIILTGLVPCLAISFLNKKSDVENVYIAGIMFGGLAFLINLIHYVFLPDFKFVLSSAFYIYNLMVFMFAAIIGMRNIEAFRRVTYYCILATIAVQFLVTVFLAIQTSIRPTGTFNNPNQLGYWAMLSACMLFVLKGRKFLNILDYLALAALFYIQLLSLSKAVMLTFGFVVIFGMLSPLTHFFQKIVTVFITLSIMIFAIYSFDTVVEGAMQSEVVQNATKRISGIGGQADDSVAGRGYIRMATHPEYLLFGAGEGGFKRFPPTFSDQELHSGIATMIFSYGILGALAFGAFLFFVFRKAPWFYIAFMIPIIGYGLTHQNFRNTYFWAFLAAVYILKRLWWDEARKINWEKKQ